MNLLVAFCFFFPYIRLPKRQIAMGPICFAFLLSLRFSSRKWILDYFTTNGKKCLIESERRIFAEIVMMWTAFDAAVNLDND